MVSATHPGLVRVRQSAEAHREARRQARLALTAGNAAQRSNPADGSQSRSAAEARWQARVASLTAEEGGNLADDLARTRSSAKKSGGNSGLAVPPPMTSSSRRNRSVSYSSDNSL
jgi:Tfp pilus assembly protein PilV